MRWVSFWVSWVKFLSDDGGHYGDDDDDDG